MKFKSQFTVTVESTLIKASGERIPLETTHTTLNAWRFFKWLRLRK